VQAPAAPFGRAEIEAVLPHREPFLLIDEVVELEPGRRVVARREVRADDWWFPGHFPDRPVMPGVLIVEAMAQTGAVAVLIQEENRGKIAFFAGIDDCRFKRVVEPGDTLVLLGTNAQVELALVILDQGIVGSTESPGGPEKPESG